jgi:hypothetical protein
VLHVSFFETAAFQQEFPFPLFQAFVGKSHYTLYSQAFRAFH